ncbi:Fic family protein [Aeoliella sp. ICT_H6.2]|uniref:Fic family protein n=1 Tax=Aeoliella straminimaris TaxID=2954799 RepID=A0A9X2JI75_9BACT|nr:Fic family protein [Aeoliella straminimaris]
MQESAKTKRNPPRAPNWRPDQPYNELPMLPPHAELETTRVLKQCIPARAALEGLKEAAELIPNQAVLINTLPLLEAQSSSEIENIVTTTDRLFQHRATDDHADPATKEALRYSQALLEGFRSLSDYPLTTQTAEQVCTKIKNVEMRVRKVPGTALARSGGEVVYTPPVGEPLLRDLLANWERFMHEQTDLDPLVRLAVGHYQFEAIHPFTDGNGRTGRVLNSLFLIHEGLLKLPILYLSRYIIEHRDDYYRLLRGVTSAGQWEDWILYLVKGVEQTANWTTNKIKAIRQLAEHTTEFVRQREPKVYSHELVSVIFELPYCRIQDVVDAGIAERRAASRYLKALAELGVLNEQQSGREKLFIHPKYLQLLTTDSDDFAPYG